VTVLALREVAPRSWLLTSRLILIQRKYCEL
jgi:hypothetical protein